jgi:MoaA/NifB/PqqE/SkfB family radical SAM enzyme
MDDRYSYARRIESALRFPLARLAGWPMLVNLEVTRRCNARCDFCRYWHTRSEDRLDDYAPVIRTLKPTMVMVTGGEPLLCRDLEEIIRQIKGCSRTIYVGVMSNGALMTVQRGRSLWDAGVDQIGMSLDFLDERHDRARGIPGLAARVTRVAAQLVSEGIHNVAVNTVIKADNLDQVLPIVAWARDHGVRVSISTYTPVKAGNTQYNITGEQMRRLRDIVGELVRLRAETDTITSSTYYLEHIPQFAQTGFIGGCRAGRRMLTVAPNGDIQRCSESEVVCHFSEWTPRKLRPNGCGACWVPCRGETQAPMLTMERITQCVKVFERPAEAPACLAEAMGESARRRVIGAAGAAPETASPCVLYR